MRKLGSIGMVAAVAGLVALCASPMAQAKPSHVLLKAPPRYSGKIHCLSRTSCIAPAQAGHALIKVKVVRWNGKNWSSERVPQPESFSSMPVAACPSLSQCFAFGVESFGSGRQQYIDEWSGKHWVSAAVPRVPAVTADVACPAAKSCWAVGEKVVDSLSGVAFAQHWNGRRWKPVRTPHSRLGRIPGRGPGGVSIIVPYELQSVSCSSKRSCVAVGREHYGGYGGQTLIRWNGRRWKSLRVRLPRGSGLWAVSCVTRKFCMAVGGDPYAISYRWNGHRWFRIRTPRLAHRNTFFGAGLDEVACASWKDCVATGFRASNKDNPPKVALKWNGKRWRVVSTRRTEAVAVCDPSGHCVIPRR